MMISSFNNVAAALQHAASARVAERTTRESSAGTAPAPAVPAPRASHENVRAGGDSSHPPPARAPLYAEGPRTVTVTVTMTVRDGGQVDVVL